MASNNSSLSTEEEAASVATRENTADRPRPGEVPVPLPKNAVNVMSIDAGGGGNCFFYSLYSSLEEKGLLEVVCENLELDSTSKDTFNIKFRQLLSTYMREDYRSLIEMVCHAGMATVQRAENGNNMSKLFAEGIEMQTLGLSTQQQRILRKLKFEDACGEPGENKKMIDSLLQAVRTNGVYVADREVMKVKAILRDTCNIYLDIKNRFLPRLLPYSNRVVLLNLGENHYQWFSFKSKSGKGGRRSTKRIRRRKQRSTRRN